MDTNRQQTGNVTQYSIHHRSHDTDQTQ